MNGSPALLLAALFVVQSVPGLSVAAEPKEPVAAKSEEHSPAAVSGDIERLILLTPGRPLLIALSIQIDGHPFRQAWRDRFDRLLADEAPAGGQPDVAAAERIVAAMSGQYNLDPPAARLRADLDRMASADRRIDVPALLAYLERTCGPFTAIAGSPTAASAAPALFGLLDQDRDAQLSRSELDQAAEQLLGRDFDDDQLISPRDLVVDPTLRTDRSAAPATIADVVVVLGPSMAPESVAAALVRHFDRNADGRLSIRPVAAELSALPAAVLRLDANDDGQLDADELGGYAALPAELTLPIRFGTGGAPPAAAAGARPAGELRMRRKIDGGYKISLGDAQLDINRNNRNPLETGDGDPQFAALDTDQNEYLDAAECKASPLLAAAFAHMDSDADGKITAGELQVYVQAQNTAAAARVRLQVVDRGQDLFSLVDVNGDGLLSQRELRSAASLLDTDDRNGDGLLSGSEIPVRWSLELVRGSSRAVDQRPSRPRIRDRQLTASDAGPLWFRKMDRNRDGDLTEREFLGSAADFRAADADRDGLVDRSEAEKVAAEKRPD
jgi:Ca2+-binding EF-hand superfamily protein